MPLVCRLCFFFFNDTATTEIYTLSLHDALPILPAKGVACKTSTRPRGASSRCRSDCGCSGCSTPRSCGAASACRSEEHTSELQSRQYLVCRLLLEKKKKSCTKMLCVLYIVHLSE